MVSAPIAPNRPVLGIGIAGVVLGAGYLVQARQYPLGSPAAPGPGVFPLVVGALMVVGGLGTAIGALRRPAARPVGWPRGPALQRITLLGAAAVVFVVFLRSIGYPVVAALLAYTAMHVCGYRTVLARLVCAAVISAVTYWLLTGLLGLRLPPGILGG